MKSFEIKRFQIRRTLKKYLNSKKKVLKKKDFINPINQIKKLF